MLSISRVRNRCPLLSQRTQGCFQQLSVFVHIFRKAKTSKRWTDLRQMPHSLSPTCDQRLFSKLPDSYQNHGQVAAPSPDEEGNIYEEPNVDQESNISEIKKDKTSPVEKVLTLRQLLLRRGLALLVMVLILAVGIVANELLVRYLK